MKVNKLQFNPVFSRVDINDEVDGDEFEKWYEEKFQKTSLKVRLGIGGEVAEEELKNICNKFGISDWQKIGYTARIFRDIFCDKISEDEIKKRATQKIEIKESDLSVFVELVKKAIGSMKKAGEKEYGELIDQITLKEAVRKYPEIQEQLISNEALKIEENNYLVAGTVKNWLKDYFQRAGGNKHNSLERSDYLFRSEKAKLLNQEEKDILNVILRAFDDDSLIAVNKKEKEINFNESRFLNEGKEELEGIMKNYDNNLTEKFRQKNLNKNNTENNHNLKKIRNTPSFEVDKKESGNTNIVNLEKRALVSNDREKERGNINKKNQNTLDLSEYL
ncbi:MAG: hypothetical protein PF549_01405 [Patescibacteria group bacterium]|jgi:hypothetical protein|nr:hypothetical protein [Patescibacteria group bacterium]